MKEERPLIIFSFKDIDLHDTCTDLARAEERLGRLSAQAMARVFSDASAFDSVAELLEFLGPEAHISDNDTFCVLIGSDYMLEMTPVGTRFKRIEGKTVWSSVTRLKLAEIKRVP